MNERRKEEVYCDFKIVASGKFFPVHKVVLDNSSEYFRAMLTHSMKESGQGYCEFNEDATVVEQCIEFIYSKKMDLRPESVAQVLKLSHQWLLEGAAAECWKYMQDNVSNENCVEWINLSKLYELKELEATCMTFLLKNISQVENISQLVLQMLQSLVNKATTRPDQAKVMWNILKARIQQPDCDVPCTLVQSFNVEGLTKIEYRSSVLNDTHVSSCRPCNDYVTKRRQAHAYKLEDVNVTNCLVIKDQVVKYGNVGILEALDKYIIKKFRQICKRKKFLSLVTEDHLLKYICNIQRQCTKEEFERIVLWFRSDSKREWLFPKIFRAGKGPQSQFKDCLQALNKRKSETILSDLSSCCYLSHLAEKYSCEKILEETDYFMHRNFESISACPDIAYLSVRTMKNFASAESLCSPNDGRMIWNAVKLWGQKEDRNKDDFSKVFCCILFDKFSPSSLRTMCQNRLVKTSVECCCKLLEVGLSKLAENRDFQETHHGLLMSRICNCDSQIQQLGNQFKQVDEQNRNRWQDLERRTIEIENIEYSHWQDSNRELKEFQESISHVENCIEESMTDFEGKITDLRKVDEVSRQKLVTNLTSELTKLKNETGASRQELETNLTGKLRKSEEENDTLRKRIDVLTRQQDKAKRANSIVWESIDELKILHKLDIAEVRREQNDFKKGVLTVLIGGVMLYFCYKVYRWR